MSFLNPYPSTSRPSRNVIGGPNDYNPSLSYDQALQNEWIYMDLSPQYMGPTMTNLMQNSTSMVQNNNFEISTSLFGYHDLLISKFDIKDYNAEDLKVRIENGFIVIRGSHGEKRDEYGLVSKKFTRRIAIPKYLDSNEIRVDFSSNGVLIITAKKSPENRLIPIQPMYLSRYELSRNFEQQQRMNAMRMNELPTVNNLNETQPLASQGTENLYHTWQH